MGTDRSRDQYEGILIMDPRITAINVAGTTATEDSPQTGPITADAGFSTEAVIVASGTPEDGDSLLLRGMKAGSPGINRAGYAWRETDATNWFGWNVPSVITAFEFVEDAVSSTVGFPAPQPIPLADGTIVILAGDDTFNLRGVSRRIRNVDGTYGASVTLHQETANPGNDRLYPRGVLLPSGRLQVYHATMDNDNDEAQIRMMYTDDPSAATYTEGEAGVLEEAFDLTAGATSFNRLRVAHNPDTGQFLLVIESAAAASVLTQYASRNGVRFELVGSTIVTDGTGVDLVYSNGFFVLAYGLSGTVHYRRSGSAFTALSSASVIDPQNAATTGPTDAVSLVAADDGTLYSYAGTTALGFAVSEDTGATWIAGAKAGIAWAGEGCLATEHSAAFYRGYTYMVANQTAPAANVLALTAYRLGGYSDLTLPPEKISRNVGRQMWWANGWVGHDDPTTAGQPFTDVSAGAPALTRNTDGSWNVTTGGLDTYQVEEGIADAAAYVEVMGTMRTLVNSGTAKLAVQSSRTLPNHTEAEIRVDADIRLFDTNSGAQIGATVVGAGGVKVDLLLAVNGQDCTAWYSTVDDGNHAQTWIQIATTSTLTEAAASVTNRIQQVVVPSSDVDLWFTLFSRQDEVVGIATILIGESMADDVTLPDDLFAKSLPAIGASYVNDGVIIRGIDGPILRGVEMTMEITHPSPIESILPFVQPSPRK